MNKVNWKNINDNIVNVGRVLASILDTETAQNVDFVIVEDDGTVRNVKLNNLAIHLANIKKDAVDLETVTKLVESKTMSRDTIKQYVSENIKQIENAVSSANGDASKLEAIFSKYYTKDDVTAIMNTLKTETNAEIKQIKDDISSAKIDSTLNKSNISTLNSKLDTGLTQVKNSINSVNNKAIKVEDSLIPIVVDKNVTAVPGSRYTVDSLKDTFKLTLPNNPSDKDMIYVMDGNYNAQNNPVTITGNGKKINGKNEDLTCDVNGFYIVIRYSANNGSWYVANAVTNS